MGNRKIHIGSSQYGMLCESEWNFHLGKNHDMRPYVSDSKYHMFGRETGHFGSGTYFCTYKGSEFRDKMIHGADSEYYGDYSRYMNPNFIQVGDGIYRVDFGIYKNLYRVSSKRQGDVLYTMMRNLNAMYNRICNMGKFISSAARYDNARFYQVIRANAEALGLRCPSYYELTRMAQLHEGSQSFSTLFMEWNGFNGVNVSGIDFYDNTKHGSVIYDLSKVCDYMDEVSPKNLFTIDNSSYNDTVVYDSVHDYNMSALRGNDMFWVNKLCDMPINQALRLLKNYMDSGNILSSFEIGELSEDLAKRYLRLIFVKNPRNDWGDSIIDQDIIRRNGGRLFIDLIDKYGAYYWVNYESTYGSILVELLSNYALNLPWDIESNEEVRLKREYYDKLMSYMDRSLTEYEDEYIKENYFDLDGSDS